MGGFNGYDNKTIIIYYYILIITLLQQSTQFLSGREYHFRFAFD